MTEAKNLTQPDQERYYFGTRGFDPARIRFVTGLGLFLILLLLPAVAMRSPLEGAPAPGAHYPYPREEVLFVEVKSSQAMVRQLNRLGLWELGERTAIPPVVFTAFPPDIGELEVETRKRLFLKALAPTALVALAEVERERAGLLGIIAKIEAKGCSLERLLDGEIEPLQCGLAKNEADFIEELSARYRSEDPEVLLKRVNVVPLSLILAQAAMESSWGTSRFAREGNNLFGVWTWGGHGLVPSDRTRGMNHRVAIYDSLLDSVRSYLLMLNRVSAYRSLRDLRRETMDPLVLVNGLRYYSEKRDQYVDDLRNLILVNGFQRYDALALAADTPLVAGSEALPVAAGEPVDRGI